MEEVWDVLRDECGDAFDVAAMVRVVFRLTVAMVLGGILGYERGQTGKAAGIRTHMLVTIGSAMFVLGGVLSGFEQAGLSRVIQGIVAGIGFVGAGAILKVGEEKQVKGVTTASNIWLAAAVGACVGLGAYFAATMTTLAALVILTIIGRAQSRSDDPGPVFNGQSP